jgi:hypothetical protein
MDELHRLIDGYDRLRGGLHAAADHKEWHHFCILSPGVDVVVNFSLSGDLRSAVPSDDQVARIILLAREADHGWDGDVESVPPRDVHARKGHVGMRIGSSTLGFDSTGFTLSVALQRRPLTARLSLEPRAVPLLARADTPIADARVNWLVVPRLEASGVVVVDRRVHRLQRAPAYHDHNWGHWRWGQDFAWQWGFGLSAQADDPWALVFDRTTDRSRSTTMELTMGLWYGSELYRLFRQHEVAVQPAGYTPVRRILKVPRVMALLAPEQTTDIPKRLMVTAGAGRDRVQAVFTTEDAAQIVVPNETDLGVTVINEVPGTVAVEGTVKGRRVASSGRGIGEFLT